METKYDKWDLKLYISNHKNSSKSLIVFIRKYFVYFWLYFLINIKPIHCLSQSADSLPKLNQVFLEIGGVGGFGSINYERILNIQERYKINGTVGFSTYHFVDYNQKINPDLIFPFSLNFLFGNQKMKLETGIGMVFTSINVYIEGDEGLIKENNVHYALSLKARYDKKNMCYKFGLNSIFHVNIKNWLWGGFSMGYKF